MLGLGLACSNAPSIFLPAEHWPKIYDSIPPDTTDLEPFYTRGEKPEQVQGYMTRVDAAFSALQAELERFKPDALVVLGADDHEVFSRINFPALHVYYGEAVTAVKGFAGFPETVNGTVDIACHSELAVEIVRGLTERGFEPSFGNVFNPIGRTDGGLSHSLAAPVLRLTSGSNIPIVPISLNCLFPPLPSAARCFDLGVTLAEILAERPERVALLASGGLSYDPMARWVDEPFDRWIIDTLSRGKVADLKKLFKVDSENFRGYTGAIRTWITVAAACSKPAKVLDYIPARHAKTGLCFAYWPMD